MNAMIAGIYLLSIPGNHGNPGDYGNPYDHSV